MKELSLNILDIAKNSVKAGASLVEILLKEKDGILTLKIRDNGCGMEEALLKDAANPFTTTRTTRKVGLGLPLLKLAAEQTGGNFSIQSIPAGKNPDLHGTEVTAVFYENHIDFTPLGDVASSYTTLIQGNPQIDFIYRHETPGGTVNCDTRELRKVLGDEISLNDYEIICWIEDYIREQAEQIIQ